MALFPDSSYFGRAIPKPKKLEVSTGLNAYVEEVVTEALKRQITKEAMGSLAKVGNVPNDLELALMPKPKDIGEEGRYNEDGSPKYR